MEKLHDAAVTTLLKNNVLLLEGDFNSRMIEHVYYALIILEARGSPDIEIRIYSNGGGRVGVCLDVFDAIRRYKGKKTGVVYAYARSMGAIVLQACDKRICLRHATVLIHHIHVEEVSLDVLENKTRLARLQKSMWNDQKKIYAILQNRTGRSEKEIRKACSWDVDMNSEEAKRFGLIDEIEG